MISSNTIAINTGAAVTVGFLLRGIAAFMKGEEHKCQRMLQGRVLAQGMTFAVIFYSMYNK